MTVVASAPQTSHWSNLIARPAASEGAINAADFAAILADRTLLAAPLTGSARTPLSKSADESVFVPAPAAVRFEDGPLFGAASAAVPFAGPAGSPIEAVLQYKRVDATPTVVPAPFLHGASQSVLQTGASEPTAENLRRSLGNAANLESAGVIGVPAENATASGSGRHDDFAPYLGGTNAATTSIDFDRTEPAVTDVRDGLPAARAAALLPIRTNVPVLAAATDFDPLALSSASPPKASSLPHPQDRQVDRKAETRMPAAADVRARLLADFSPINLVVRAEDESVELALRIGAVEAFDEEQILRMLGDAVASEGFDASQICFNGRKRSLAARS